MSLTNNVKKTVRTREPKCQRCKVHGRQTNLKGHKRFCLWRNCKCEHCSLLQVKQAVARKQIKLTREQQQDKELLQTASEKNTLGPYNQPVSTMASQTTMAPINVTAPFPVAYAAPTVSIAPYIQCTPARFSSHHPPFTSTLQSNWVNDGIDVNQVGMHFPTGNNYYSNQTTNIEVPTQSIDQHGTKQASSVVSGSSLWRPY